MIFRHNLPSQARELKTWLAAMCAVASVAVVAPASAQIEVDVLTTGTENAEVTTSGVTAEQPATSTPSVTSGLKQDKSADDAARRIVPAPGTQMQSTEGGTLDNSAAVAAEPSLKVEEGGVVLQDGESTETLAVNSGAELLKLLGVQMKKKSGDEPLESDESTTSSLFDVDAIRKLKGSEPTVIYRVVIDETPLPDPMIVPWIRQAKLLQERFDKAVQLLGENRVDEGRGELLGIITDFPDSDYARQSQALLTKLEDLSQPVAPQVVQEDKEATVTVELSPNVQIGAVIVDPENPVGNRVMIGSKAYSTGDEISGIPGHRVIGITDSVIQIEVEQSGIKKIFDVPVRPRGANN